jgi:AraC-like DNA-binding protein
MKFIKNNFHLLNVDAVKLGTDWNFTNVISPYYRLYYIAGGEGHINSLAGKTQLITGNLYLIPSYTLCDLHCDDYMEQYFIQFFEDTPEGISIFGHYREIMSVKADPLDMISFERIIAINPGRGINRSFDPKVYEKDIFYKEYTKLNELQSISVRFETQGIILALLSRFMRSKNFLMCNQTTIPLAVTGAIRYIQMNISKSLKVSLLASIANLSVNYFSRIFHQSTGKSPASYVLEKRIERAQYLVTTTSMQYKEIAELAGFENQQYFSRIFKNMTGLSPKAYRKQSQGWC